MNFNLTFHSLKKKCSFANLCPYLLCPFVRLSHVGFGICGVLGGRMGGFQENVAPPYVCPCHVTTQCGLQCLAPWTAQLGCPMFTVEWPSQHGEMLQNNSCKETEFEIIGISSPEKNTRLMLPAMAISRMAAAVV